MSYLTDKGQTFICSVCVLKLSDIRARKLLLGCDHETAGGRPGQPGPRLGLHLRGGSPLRSLPRGLRVGRRHRRLPGGGQQELLILTLILHILLAPFPCRKCLQGIFELNY